MYEYAYIDIYIYIYIYMYIYIYIYIYICNHHASSQYFWSACFCLFWIVVCCIVTCHVMICWKFVSKGSKPSWIYMYMYTHTYILPSGLYWLSSFRIDVVFRNVRRALWCASCVTVTVTVTVTVKVTSLLCVWRLPSWSRLWSRVYDAYKDQSHGYGHGHEFMTRIKIRVMVTVTVTSLWRV